MLEAQQKAMGDADFWSLNRCYCLVMLVRCPHVAISISSSKKLQRKPLPHDEGKLARHRGGLSEAMLTIVRKAASAPPKTRSGSYDHALGRGPLICV